MRMRLLFILCVLCFTYSSFAQPSGTLQSPESYLPTHYGDQFTPHHLQVEYFEYVAANSDRVQLMEYGRTNEDRPLILAFVSSPENLTNLEAIREAHLARINGETEGADDYQFPIVWLSFGVHGNEAGAAESSLSVVYQLASGDQDIASMLEETVVIIDPNLNPDGNSRYTSWYRSISGTHPDPDFASREHAEPWPRGRVNHYYFDLNRDWAWATQVETQHRLVEYRRWMPHIHVDAHEQYPNDPFYFAPAAHPFHPAITEFQEEFQTMVGQNNARAFDQEGWLYFTREVFDLFYPSYGDTYPTFNGAIGMTYEQAGHGISGRAIEMDNGDTLTLQDRIDHHSTAAMATVGTAFWGRQDLLQNFEEYFNTARTNPAGDYKSFIISNSNPADRITALCDLLDLHGIEYGKAVTDVTVSGWDYQDGRKQSIPVEANDLVIPTNQLMGNLVRVLFEPEPYLEDSLTYDITAWALPYAYGLEAVASDTRVNFSSTPAVVETPQIPVYTPEAPQYAYAIRWESMEDSHFLAEALQAGLKVRYASGSFATKTDAFEAGTLLFTRADNRKNPKWEPTLLRLAALHLQEVVPINTGMSMAGPDLGSASMRFIAAPRVLLAFGDRFDNNAVGATWHYFEQVLDYPVTMIEDTRINARSLDDYDLLVVVSGRLDFGDNQWADLTSWVRSGGRIIATGGGLSNFRDRDGYGLTALPSPPDEDLESDPMSYGGRERSFIPQSVPGAIFTAKLDETHPLAFGIGDQYHSVKTSGTAYAFPEGGLPVGYLEEDYEMSGFAGWKAKKRLENSLVIGHKPMGAGSIIYLVDDPLFRGFWYQGLFLMSNAIFLAN